MQSQRLSFRRLSESDRAFVASLETNPEVTKYTRIDVLATQQERNKRFDDHLQNQKQREPLGGWIVELKTGGGPIGWMMALETEFAFPEVGLMFAPEFWGQGYGHEAMVALKEHVTETFGHGGLTAVIDKNNIPSLKLFKKCGLRQALERADSLVFEYLTPEP